MWAFLFDHWEAVVASIALLQPWMYWVYRRFQIGQIDTHETATIEVGFSFLGPIINLNGTLRAIYREQFVRTIRLTVTRLEDSASHSFTWGLFRAHQVFVNRTEELQVELPRGFLISPQEPYRYGIIFFDLQSQKKLTSILTEVRSAWQAFSVMAARMISEHSAKEVDASSLMNKPEVVAQFVYEQFEKEQVFLQATTKIGQLFYWIAGHYSIDMEVVTDRPKRSFHRQWNFSLSQIDSDRLYANARLMLRQCCTRENVQYEFAYLPYEDAP